MSMCSAMADAVSLLSGMMTDEREEEEYIMYKETDQGKNICMYVCMYACMCLYCMNAKNCTKRMYVPSTDTSYLMPLTIEIIHFLIYVCT